MKVITAINRKGGTGKTTSVASIGSILARKNYKVLMIDLDSQCSLGTIFNIKKKTKKNIFEVLTNKNETINDNIISTGIKNLDLVNGSENLEDGQEILDKILYNDKNKILLQTRINEIKTKYDYVLIDCHPNLSFVTIEGLVAADQIIIPTSSNKLDLIETFSILSKFSEITNLDSLNILILPTKILSRGMKQEVLWNLYRAGMMQLPKSDSLNILDYKEGIHNSTHLDNYQNKYGVPATAGENWDKKSLNIAVKDYINFTKKYII